MLVCMMLLFGERMILEKKSKMLVISDFYYEAMASIVV